MQSLDKQRVLTTARMTALCVLCAVLGTASFIVILTLTGVLPLYRFIFELQVSSGIAVVVTLLVAPPVIWKVGQTADALRETKAELYHQARTDYLTGLLNRRGFESATTDLIEAAVLNQEPVALIACDIDHFKAVNDTYGHGAGDRVIVSIAQTIKDEIETGADVEFLAGRMGGEEFAFILRGIAIKPLKAIAESVRHRCAETSITHGDSKIAVTVSVGTSIMSYRDANLETLLTAADRGLYRAKNNGRNRVEHVSDTSKTQIAA